MIFHDEGSPELACLGVERGGCRDILDAVKAMVGWRRRCGVRRPVRRASRPTPASRCSIRAPTTCSSTHGWKMTAPTTAQSGLVGLSHCHRRASKERNRYPLVRDRIGRDEPEPAGGSGSAPQAVLKLRALRASGDFDAYWDFHEAREYES